MVISTLDEKLIKSGERLLQQLDSENILVDAALWLYFPDSQNWKLLLSFPNIIQQGPKAAYEKVQNILNNMVDMAFSLGDVAIAKDDAPLLTVMRTAINTGPGISGVRFSNNVINGQLIQDAYIYRMVRVNKDGLGRSPNPSGELAHYKVLKGRANIKTGGDDPLKVFKGRANVKVGRNDPCPCGSGKKYKKCHGAFVK